MINSTIQYNTKSITLRNFSTKGNVIIIAGAQLKLKKNFI